MPTAVDNLLVLLLETLNQPLGLVVACSSPKSFEALFQKTVTQNKNQYPDLLTLAYSPSPHAPNEFWIYHKDRIRQIP